MQDRQLVRVMADVLEHYQQTGGMEDMVASQQDIEDVQEMDMTTSQQPNLQKFDADEDIYRVKKRTAQTRLLGLG